MYNEKGPNGKYIKKYKEEDVLPIIANLDIITTWDVELELKCSQNTALDLLKKLEERGFLKSKRARVGYIFWKV